MKTETQDRLLQQRDLGRAPGHHTLWCGTYGVGPMVWGHGVALTLMGREDLHGRTGEDQDTEESSSCSSRARHGLGHLAFPRLVFGTGWHCPPGTSCRR